VVLLDCAVGMYREADIVEFLAPRLAVWAVGFTLLVETDETATAANERMMRKSTIVRV